MKFINKKLKTFIVFISFFASLYLHANYVFANDFKSIDQKLSFLGHLRREVPHLYSDFILRNQAIEFLDRAQEAIEQLPFQKNKAFDGKEILIYSNTPVAVKADIQELNKNINLLIDFAQSYDSSLSVVEALKLEVKRAAMLEGLRVGILRTKDVANTEAWLKIADAEEQIKAAAKIFENVNVINGLNPRLVGINKDQITGLEFIEAYKNAVSASTNTAYLYWLAVFGALKNEAFLARPVQEMSLLLKNITKEDLNLVSDQEKFMSVVSRFVKQVEVPPTVYWKFAKKSFSTLKSLGTLHEVASTQPYLTITRVHPYESYVRGSVGDCSTCNSFAVPMAKNEEVYWIKKDPRGVVGYLQISKVKVDGQSAAYLHTISGSDLSRTDTFAAIHAISEALPSLGVQRLVLPVAEKMKDIINYPEVEAAFKEIIKLGATVDIVYEDALDRAALAPFTEDSFDLPETNKKGVEVKPADTKKFNQFSVKIRSTEVKPSSLFPQISKQEALIITLELKNRELPEEKLKEILATHQISKELFDDLWKIQSNENRKPVAEFHEQVKQAIKNLNAEVDWTSFKNLTLFYRGHFNAPDALNKENSDLAMKYITAYLLAYSDLDSAYTTLTPHFSKLTQEQKFIKLIKLLFRRNLREMQRLLDSYELEKKSAYRTLIKLFQAGLSREMFQSELDALELKLEEQPQYKKRYHGTFIRRQTMLGMIYPENIKYFNQLMDFFEDAAIKNIAIEYDDIRAAANYLSDFSNRPKTTKAQILRIENFLMSSELGLSFAPALGMFKIDKFNIPAYVELLFSKGKFQWVAYLIHKEPWSKHRFASKWLATLWQNRDEVGVQIFLEGLRVNQTWLRVPGVDVVIEGLMPLARADATSEALMTRILLYEPNKLNVGRLKWLSEISSPALAEVVVNHASNNKDWSVSSRKWILNKLEKKLLNGASCPGYLKKVAG